MIKIESGFSSIKKKRVPLKTLAQEHYERVVSEKGIYISPLKKLIQERDGLKRKSRSEDHLLIEFLEKVTEENEFKKLIVSPLSLFNGIIEDYKGYDKLFEAKNTRDKILNLFGFKRLRSLKMMYHFANDLGVKTCPYCNSQYILTLAKSKKANLHFDHYYSQKSHPFLSLSYFNLIPCCSSCNISKSSKIFDTENNVHPYLESLHEKFLFKVNRKDIIDMIVQGVNDPAKINIDIVPHESFERITGTHVSNFNIQEIYDNHKDVAMEVVAKAYAYPDTYAKNLQEIFPLTPSDIQRLLLGSYTLESEINKRPLTKFIQDIYFQTKKSKL